MANLVSLVSTINRNVSAEEIALIKEEGREMQNQTLQNSILVKLLIYAQVNGHKKKSGLSCGQQSLLKVNLKRQQTDVPSGKELCAITAPTRDMHLSRD